MVKSARRNLNDLSLQAKLMALFAGLIVLLCTAVFVAVYVTSTRNSLEQIRYSANQSFAQGQTFIENKVQSAIYASEVILNNREVQGLLDRVGGEAEVDLGEEYREMSSVWNLLITLQTQDIFNACLLIQDSFTYSEQGINFGRFSDIEQNEAYSALMASAGQPHWYPPMDIQIEKELERMICLMRVIRAPEDYGRIIGIQRIGIQAGTIDEILQMTNITKTGITYLINSDGALISGSQSFHQLNDPGAAELRLSAVGEWAPVAVEGREYLAKSAPIQNTDWRMISLIPTLEFQEMGRGFLPTLLAWLLPLLLAGIAAIWIISRSVTKRVSTLSSRMTQVVSSGDLSIRMEDHANDEIGQLCTTFNYMVENLEQMVQERYEQGKAIKQMELKALQAQINPHFLYNTLDLMNWMALGRDAPELAELARTMARFYRLSLGRGRDFVHLEDEAEHAATYLQIQNRRFKDRIVFTADVPEALKQLEVPKLIFQPLVENSVLHGMESGAEQEKIHIELTARQQNDDLIITIRDDGVGMSEEEIAHLLQTDPDAQSGYGVRNIDTRIRLCYGEGYGLSFKSERGKGALVTLRMPAQRIRR